MGLYNFLSQKSSATFDEICAHIGLEEQPGRVLLTGLTALGLIKKNDDNYENATLTEKMLVDGKEGSAAPILGWQRYIVYEGLIDFVESLKKNKNVGLDRFPGEGKTLYERLSSDPFREKKFHDAMSALSKQASQHMVDALPLETITHIVDAGGGDGSNAISLCRKFPHLKATVFDRESVCKMAREKIEKEGMGTRIGTWTGNFLTDPFPEGIDAVLYAHIVTIYSQETNVAMLRKAYESLKDGGRVIIFGMFGDDDDTGPLSTALGSPYFQAIATGEGMLYSWKDAESWLGQIGFRKVERIGNLPLNHGVLIGWK